MGHCGDCKYFKALRPWHGLNGECGLLSERVPLDPHAPASAFPEVPLLATSCGREESSFAVRREFGCVQFAAKETA